MILIDSRASILVAPWSFGQTFELESCSIGGLKNAGGEPIKEYGKRSIPVVHYPIGDESW